MKNGLLKELVCYIMIASGREKMKENLLKTKSLAFSVRIVGLYRYLTEQKKEYILSKQILRSGTSIGANIYEANYGQSKVDFAAKLQIALKEAAETEYWLLLLTQTNYLEESMGKSLNEDCLELKRLLISSVRTARDQK
jgi:four helix bundle protein